MASETAVNDALANVAAATIDKSEADPVLDAIIEKKEPDPKEKPDEELPDNAEEEKVDKETDSEEDDADSEENATDEDDPLLTVTVDGTDVEVKLSDLKKNYSGNGAIEKRLQQATELRNGYYQVGEQLFTNLQAQTERLKHIDTVLKSVAEPNIDWDRLRQLDPQRYLIERDKAREAQDKRSSLAQEAQRLAHEQQELTALHYQTKVQEETGKFLEKVPEMRDPEVAAKLMQAFNQEALHYGFSANDVSGIVDHRQLMVLRDAVRYRQLMSKQQSKAPAIKPPASGNGIKQLMRPGANGQLTQRMTNARAAKADYAKARETGSVDDVAKLLIQRRK
jgi:hypothetical protein